MSHEKTPSPYDLPPIPTYEEATSSRPVFSQSRFGPSEISDDAERQGLLTQGLPPTASTRRADGYQPPTVESARSSLDSDLYLPELASDDSDDSGSEGSYDEARLGHPLEQIEVLDIEDDDSGARRRARIGARLSKRISSLTTSLSFLHLPSLRFSFPSFGFITSRIPRIPRIPDRYRPKWHVVARLFGLLLIASLVYALFVLQILPGRRGLGSAFHPEWVREFVQAKVDRGRLSDNLKHISGYSHIAGSMGSLYLAKWIETTFKTVGLDEVTTTDYHVYLNYPVNGGRRVAIVEPRELFWEAQLEEKPVFENPTHEQEQTLNFHGLSRAGNVTGPLVYANYGSDEDFRELAEGGIAVNGSIVLVRYYGTQSDRAMKVRAAELAGAVGCLIYSDPNEDGFVRGKEWPKGRWRPSDSVQRGSVALTSWVVGDVLTPGWASTIDSKRTTAKDNPGLVNIPSIPLSWRDAQKLLQSLKGHGAKVPKSWIGGVPGVSEWWTGDAGSPKVNLMNTQEEVEKRPISNVLGLIEGIETSSKRIIVGNHRDSWCFGSVDPGSGTAVMLEVASILGALVTEGWRPLRSIEFASWDGEEYNLIGSTEYVEDNIEQMRENAIAYINVDVGVSGDEFTAAGSPILREILKRALGRVSDPLRNATLKTIWEQNGSLLEDLGGGSDYVAFQDLAGCSSIDVSFDGPKHGYPYHSCYETYDWMDRFGDPGFLYHSALAQVVALMVIDLAMEPILPFDMRSFSAATKRYIDQLENDAKTTWPPGRNLDERTQLDLSPLRQAAKILEDNAEFCDIWVDSWYNNVYTRGGFETSELGFERLSYNDHMRKFETDLLDLPTGPNDHDQHGIPGREQYKHVIFGPSSTSSGYDAAIFPAVRDALHAGDWKAAQTQVDKAAKILKRAAEGLLTG